MIRRILFVLALLWSVPSFAQVVAQGQPATTSDAKAWPVKIVFGDAQVDPRSPTASDAGFGAIAPGQTGVLNMSLLHFYNSDLDQWLRVGDGANGTSRLPVELIGAQTNGAEITNGGMANSGISFLYAFNGSTWIPLPGNDSAGLNVQGSSLSNIDTNSGLSASHLSFIDSNVTTILLNTSPFTVSTLGGYIRQDSGATIAKESGGNLATVASVVRAEDSASADADKGVTVFAVRKATPANTSGTDGDYEALQVSAGRLWASAVIDTALPAGNNNIGDVDVVTLPANASVNQTQWNGTTVDTNSGTKSAGTLRVVLATDQPALTNKLLVTPDSVALPANQSVNVSQFGGTNTVTGTGAGGAGIPRVTISNDSSLAANQSTNVNQFGGSAVVTGTGAGGAGIPRVTLSNDSSLAANQSVNVAQVGGAATSTAASGVQKVGIVGNAGGAVDAANNAAMPANAVAGGVQTATIDASPTAATAGNLRYELASTEGVIYVQEGGPKRFSCLVQAATVLTQCQAAPAAGLRAYVTSVSMSNEAATVQTLDIVFGTGTNCATGATALTHKWQFGTNATTTSPYDVSMAFPTPLVPTAANAICVRPSAATAFGATITGYIAP